MLNNYIINFRWDDEALVWIATSKDVSGLVLEDESFDDLVHEVQLAVPTLLSLNHGLNGDITLEFVAHRQERMVL